MRRGNNTGGIGMKIEPRLVRIFEIDDLVGSPEGFGKVIDVRENYDGLVSFKTQEVKIQFKSGTEENTSNEPRWLEVELVNLATQQEYDDEDYATNKAIY